MCKGEKFHQRLPGLEEQVKEGVSAQRHLGGGGGGCSDCPLSLLLAPSHAPHIPLPALGNAPFIPVLISAASVPPVQRLSSPPQAGG